VTCSSSTINHLTSDCEDNPLDDICIIFPDPVQIRLKMSQAQQEKPLNRADEVKDVSASEKHSDDVPIHPELASCHSPITSSQHTNQI
jgi:hypothetical protein